jgi:hypothetical protein
MFRAYTNLIARKSNIWSLSMSFDYSAAKAAIEKAGHTVSQGPQVLASDIKEIVKFGRRVFGLNEVAVRKGIANTGLLPEGFPGVVAAPVAEAAVEVAPEVTPEDAPVVPETPAEAPEATQEPAQESEPSEDAPKAEDVPADDQVSGEEAPAGEQTAQ